ncbi:MAG: FAD-binding protein, partial [Acidobacteria bacterium]|nr:FAD-binding protein [Acidobacteriota bacterium]
MTERLRRELEASLEGDVRFDALTRALYSTDASVYQIEPTGVVIVRSRDDVVRTIDIARRHGVPITARGGGTSQAGQAIGAGLQLDTAKYFNHVLEVNVSERWARVEPGLVLDELNAHLRPHRLKFAPDISTANRATVGGMISNNSSGARSVLYGKTIDHVLDLHVALGDGAVVHDVSRKVILPGLVDTHSHLGIYPHPRVPANADGNETTGPVQSVVRALDAIYPSDPGIRMAQAGGITTANIMPGSGNAVGGQTAYVKLRGRTIEDMLIHKDGIQGGMKMANGENPKRAYASRKQAPATRMAVAALQRRLFIRAQNHQKKWDVYEKKKEEDEKAEPPDPDIALDPVIEILQGKRTVHFHTHRADDIMTAIRLAEEFQFPLVLQHVSEGY